MAKASELFIKKELLNRRDFVKGLLGGCFMLMTGCSHEDVLGQFQSNSDSSPDVHFGTGEDGDITVYSGTVDIRAIYEDDVVMGVITGRGTDKGLNRKGIDITDYYDPQNGRYINAKNFTIQSSGTLTAANPYGDGVDGKKGIIWIACTETFENQGLIDVKGKGGTGGAGGTGSGFGNTGNGSGGGQGGHDGSLFGGGIGGSIYGDSVLSINNWKNLYGSGGGGGGCGMSNWGGTGGGGGGYAENGGDRCEDTSEGSNETNGSMGGNGGGAIRLYVARLVTTTGYISADGDDGSPADSGYNNTGGAGGGGSGGSIYIETLSNAEIGSGIISAKGGLGGERSGYANGGTGGDGSIGRIAVKSPDIIGTTIPAYYDIEKGAYSS
ncbi:MAG TPA: hypothetical protein PK253_17960 [Spirochaetota bacterium]|nr:hypothetical protein [Spirochaetota bacterium]